MSETDSKTPTRVLVTGAEGYVGRMLVETLASGEPTLEVVATDVRAPRSPLPRVTHEVLDITSARQVDAAIAIHEPDVVVHLAAVVTPRPDQGRDAQYAVDVEGTSNVVRACVAHGVDKLVYTSSGAAYGYYPDNPPLLREDDEIRGTEVFAYAWHKRLVEDLLAEARTAHPELRQLIFRVSTILGTRVQNQITAMFERPFVLGVEGVDTPFCLVWDEDVVACLRAGIVCSDSAGVYNLTADGVMTLREIAVGMGRRYVALPERWIRAGLEILSSRGIAPYGPEQVMFLKSRPVLANDALVEQFGFRPRRSTREVFDVYRRSRR